MVGGLGELLIMPLRKRSVNQVKTRRNAPVFIVFLCGIPSHSAEHSFDWYELVSVCTRPAPPRPSVRGGRSPVPGLPFACICQEWFAVSIAMVRVVKGQEQQDSWFGDCVTYGGCGNHQDYHAFWTCEQE